MIDRDGFERFAPYDENFVAKETEKKGKEDQPEFLGEATWESREDWPLPEDLFKFQLKCALEISAKSGLPLDGEDGVVNTYTPFLRPEMWERRESYDPKDFEPLLSEEKIVDTVLAKIRSYSLPDFVPYRHGDRFGCFSYTYQEPQVHMHFTNAEFGLTGPLVKEKIEQRKKEITDMMNEVKRNYPDATEVVGDSWLYNFPSYTRLYPPDYTAHPELDEDPGSWKQGTKIWGQFLSSDYKLKQDMADQFLSNIQKLPRGLSPQDFSKVLLTLLPYPPLKVHASIDKFYDFYGIKK